MVVSRNKLESEDLKLKFDRLDFISQGTRFQGFMCFLYSKVTLETIRHQFGSLLIILSQSNLSLRSSFLVI